MRRLVLYQVDAFTRRRFTGNPAGVVPEAEGLDDDEMQAIARELNNSETAFLLPPDGGDHDVRVRFFTPSREVPTCGHATVAAHFLRAELLGLPAGTVRQKIGIGTLPVEIVRGSDGIRIFMTQGPPELGPPLGPPLVDEALAGLGLRPADLDPELPIQPVSTGSPKLLVPVRDLAILRGLRPDMGRLVRLSEAIGHNGVTAFALLQDDAEALVESRMFAPILGIPEDPVTGNGNGPLGCYLVLHGRIPTSDGEARLVGRQGVVLQRPGLVEVIVAVEDGRPARVQAGGNAVIAFRAELSL